MEAIREQLTEVVRANQPMTVRQVFYRMVSRPDTLVAKTEAEYKTTVMRLLVELRKAGVIPFDWIADNTRWMRKPKTFTGAAEALETFARAYRRDLWDEQDVYVEIWTEKDAIAGVLLEETRKFDVPLMVSRGFSSWSFLHSAAENINEQDKPAFLYYFGDHDPSGRAIDPTIERVLRELAPEAEITFERVAVTQEQITEWSLPTRPTKKTDSRSKNFEGDSVEVDAIAPEQLRQLACDCILRHIDRAVHNRVLEAEALERTTLKQYAAAFADVTDQ